MISRLAFLSTTIIAPLAALFGVRRGQDYEKLSWDHVDDVAANVLWEDGTAGLGLRLDADAENDYFGCWRIEGLKLESEHYFRIFNPYRQEWGPWQPDLRKT